MPAQTPSKTPHLAPVNAMRLVNLAFALGLFYLAVAIPVFWLVLPNSLVLWEHVVVTVVALCLLLYVNATKRPAVAQIWMVWIAAITVVTLILSGGLFNAGTYLMLPAYVFIYLLIDARRASQVIRIIFWVILAAYLLHLAGIITLPYSKLNFAVFLFSYSMTYVFFIAYSRQKEAIDSRLEGTLNDNETLIVNLEREKASVEQKVAERTRELLETQARLTASVHSLPFGFAIIDSQENIVASNDLLGQMLGHPKGKAGESAELTLAHIGTHLKSIRLRALVKGAQKSRRPVERDVAYEILFLRLFLNPIVTSTGEVIGTVMILEDTTQQKAMEHSREEFFSIASHELRTPLTAIRGNISLIQEFYPKLMKNKDLNQMLTDAHDASIRLIQIVNDFLDTSRLEQGRLVFKLEPMDPTELIRFVEHEFDVSTAKHKFSFDLPREALPSVQADRDRMRQVLINLMSNAVKYTPEGGHINLRARTEGSMLKIQVKDDGQGVPEESQSMLFRKFQQASNNLLRDNTKSTGLGLYISRLMAQGMHGKLYLETSKPGHGSTFTLEVPLVSAD